MSNRGRRLGLTFTLVLLGANLLAFNFLIGDWSARVDLTEESVFSVTDATKRIVRSVDEPVTIYGFFSERTHPKLAPLVPEIIDVLDEYRAVSGGKVQVEILDPGRDEAAEELAADRFGVQSAPFRLNSKYETGIVNAFFSLVIQYGDRYERYGFSELIDVEPLPDGDVDVTLRNLEYDVTRAIKKVVSGFNTANDLFERIEQPVKLTAYITPDGLPDLLSEVPEALRNAAAELTEAGRDKFIFEERNPATDPQAQATLDGFGLRPLSLSLFSDQTFYLYAILEVGGQLEQVVLAEEGVTAATLRESIEASLRRNTPGFLKTVGVFAPAPPQLPPQFAMQMPQDRPEFEQVKALLRQEYETESVQLDQRVPSNVDVLVVLKPKSLTPTQSYHLDQYVMRGGRLILCAGQFESNIDASGLSVLPLDTGLDDWLAHIGVAIDETLVLDDQNQAWPVPVIRNTPFGQLRDWELTPYPYLVQVRGDGFADRDVTSALDAVGIYWGSPVRVLDAETSNPDVEIRELLRSSEESWTDDDLFDINRLDYVVPEETAPTTLAVALSGTFDSFFAESGPPAPDGPDTPGINAATLKRSPETRIVVIGNGEFLSDYVAGYVNQVDGSFFIENLRFLQNVVDWMSLDNDLASIRSRGLVSRRLEASEPGQRQALEIANYVIPTVALLAFATWTFRRRRLQAPVLRPTGASGDRS